MIRTTALGMNARNIYAVYPNNSTQGILSVNDKVETKELLTENNVAVPKTVAVIESMFELESLGKYLVSDVVLKPAHGSGGGGILLLSPVNENSWQSPSGTKYNFQDIIQHAAEILHGRFSFGDDDVILIEELLIAHDEISSLHPPGLADIRLIYLNNEPLLAMLRMPTIASDGKANLHQNGVAAPIDMDSGVIGKVFDGNGYSENHPDGAKVEGVILSSWKDVISVAEASVKCAPIGYVGVDIVIDKRLGPVVLELNARPGLEIQNVNLKSLAPWVLRN